MPNSPYTTDLTNSAWELIAPLLPGAQPGGRPRTTNVRAVLNAIFYLLRTGCQTYEKRLLIFDNVSGLRLKSDAAWLAEGLVQLLGGSVANTNVGRRAN